MKMKIKKKLTAIIGVVVLVAALLAAIVVLLINNVGDTIISVESQTALVGDALRVPISIDKNHGLYYGQIVVKYDATKLEYISAANGEVFEQCSVNGADIVGMLYIIVNETGVENVEKDGVITALNFKIKETAKKGDSPITLYQPEFVDEGTHFYRFQDLDQEIPTVPKCKNGVITIK